ncbi:MAG TPA: amidase family protein [Acidimicrobiales bacterium]|nr:amidase family protein [Acidimicrobiales bacterium]
MAIHEELRWLDATDTAGLIRSGDVKASEVVEAAIERAEEAQPVLNFMVTDTFDRARARVAASSGPFAGVPFLVKDMFDVQGVPTRWGARFGPFLPPAANNSPQVDAFEAAGLVVIGKSALGEIGYLPTTEPLVTGPTANPWNPSLSPGGSSGGSAAAVAAGVVPVADAADGGGSIRIPASACGLFGLKPSRDRLVGEQAPAAGYPLTVEHCLSRSVRDSAALFAEMEGAGDLPRVGHVGGRSPRRLRIGLLATSLAGRQPSREVQDGVDATVALLTELGHHVEEASYAFDTAPVMADFSVLYASSALGVRDMVAGFTGTEPDESLLEPFTLAMAATAASLPEGALEETKARMHALSTPYEISFATHDLFLSPVMLTPPVPTGHIAGDTPFDLLVERLGAYVDYTVLHNLVGAPAMSVPLWWTPAGIPVGLQFAARVGDERTLFELAYELEQARPWADRRPPARP